MEKDINLEGRVSGDIRDEVSLADIEIIGVQPHLTRREIYVLGNYPSGTTRVLSESEFSRKIIPEHIVDEIKHHTGLGYSLVFGSGEGYVQ